MRGAQDRRRIAIGAIMETKTAMETNKRKKNVGEAEPTKQR